jgi:hypothetical protein
MKKIFLLSFLALTSCAFFNKKTVELGVDSFPQGAEIYVNDKYLGETPSIINIPPKESFITLSKKGYGTASFKTPIFIGAIRTKADGSVNADGVRCLLDMASVVFFFNAYTGRCSDFKEKQYKISIPNNHSSNSFYDSNAGYGSGKNYNYNNVGGYDNVKADSVVGVKSDPANVVNYYYDQEVMKNIRGPDYVDPYKNSKNKESK